MPRAAADAYHQAVERRTTLAPPGVPFVFLNPLPGTTPMPVDPRDAFAALINAKREEISYIPNTSTGENLVVEALEITRFDKGATGRRDPPAKGAMSMKIRAPAKSRSPAHAFSVRA
jgi:hypothetical protein